MKKYLIVPILLVLLLTLQAHASIYVWTSSWGADFTDVDVAYNGGNAGTAGFYNLFIAPDSNAQNIWYTSNGFCVQPGVPIGQGLAEFNLIETESHKAAAWLMHTYLGDANTSYKKTGLQLAVWDALRLLDSATYGSLTISDNNLDSYDEYEIYKAGLGDALDTDEYKRWSASGYAIINFDDDTTQDMIVRVVPEPGTMLLFGIGLLGIGAIGRKKF